MLQSVAIQWLIRRIPDWGGWLAVPVLAVISFFAGLTPAQQELVTNLLEGNWERVTMGAFIGFLPVIYANIISFRATNKPQAVVEENGKLVTNTLAPKKEKEVADVVTNVSSRKTLLDIVLGR